LLARVDFRRPEISRLAARLSPGAPADRERVVELVTRFCEGPRGCALASATVVHREQEFILRWPPEARDAPRFVHGFVDCLYQDAEGWHLLDYKTNAATAAEVPALAARYALQAQLYGLAIEQGANLRLRSVVLCFLSPAVEYPFAWDDEARQAARRQVDAALATAAPEPA
jgi:ATP-dependent helicase/nuclease subunit A